MRNAKIGSPVRVDILDRAKMNLYAHGAADAFNGAVGVVTKDRADGMLLVTFTKPVEKWAKGPATEFWFPQSELEVVTDEPAPAS